MGQHGSDVASGRCPADDEPMSGVSTEGMRILRDLSPTGLGFCSFTKGVFLHGIPELGRDFAKLGEFGWCSR